MTLDERVKYQRLVRFLLPKDIENILRHSLSREELVILGMKSPTFSAYPAGKRKRMLIRTLNNLEGDPSQPTLFTIPGKNSLDSVVWLLSGEIYHQASGPTQTGSKDKEGNVIVTDILAQRSVNYAQLIHHAIKLLDKINNKYIVEVESNNSATLQNRLVKEKEQLNASGEIHRWICALVTSELMSKNLLAAQLSEFMSTKSPNGINIKGEEHFLVIQAFSTELYQVEAERARLAQQVAEVQKQRDEKSSALETAESERNRLRLDYERLEREYGPLEATTKELQAKIQELGSRPKEDGKELTKRIKALEAERDSHRAQAEENIALSESYLLDMQRQREAHDLEKRKLQARIQGLTRLLERYNGNGTEPHEETMEERFVGAGLDYELINAVVVGGSQNLTRRAGTPLTAVNWRKNTLGKLADKSKIGQFDAVVDMLVSQGVLIQIDRDVLSVSSDPDGVADPVLKMYLADVLKDPTRYRS